MSVCTIEIVREHGGRGKRVEGAARHRSKAVAASRTTFAARHRDDTATVAARVLGRGERRSPQFHHVKVSKRYFSWWAHREKCRFTHVT
jgi:hypothetical protein